MQFAPPPEATGGRTESPRNKAIAEMLKKRPGEWAKVATGEKSDSLAVRIRSGSAKSFRYGEWEAVSRKNDKGSIDIYARYIRG